MKKYKKVFRSKKKALNIKIVLPVLVLLIICSGIVYLLFFSSIFKVKHIEVLGVEKIATAQVESIVSENMNEKTFF